MEVYEVLHTRWSFKLALRLIGQVQQAYAELTPHDAKDYTKLKQQSWKGIMWIRTSDNGLDKPGESKENWVESCNEIEWFDE